MGSRTKTLYYPTKGLTFGVVLVKLLLRDCTLSCQPFDKWVDFQQWHGVCETLCHPPPQTERAGCFILYGIFKWIVRMGILALDLGSTSGWAYGKKGERPISGSILFKGGRFEGGGMRFLRFKNWLDAFLDCNAVETVYFEEVRNHKGVDASHIYGGLMAILTSWCEGHKIPYEGVPVGTIKRHATGKGNANKQAMIDAVTAKGFSPKDDNEADAISLWFCVTDLLLPAEKPV
ncbi:holliday junction resolvasE [Caudoviricetes sp.]|nr:holliday junction resolvasE [Caudoviricetes sp.]